jgi:hypothetical protein
MKWITRDHVHMDRVASPWLIRRFIDGEAEFLFVPLAKALGASLDPSIELPADAIPFALPGAEIGPHDAAGSTFRKLMNKYGLKDPALEMMARIVESGVEHVFHHHEPGYSVARLSSPEGVGLDALSIGMMYACADDVDNLRRSRVIYDALYDYCNARLLEAERPELARLGVPERWDVIKRELAARRPRLPG